MRATFFAVSLVVASLLPAFAAEKTVNLKLVTKHLETKDGEAKFFGVAVTPEGRIGVKDWTFKPADSTGLSTYSWDDGSAITASFTLKQGSEKGHFTGEYTILSGAGAYSGATGTGSFKGRDPSVSGLKGAGLVDVVLKVNAPSQ